MAKRRMRGTSDEILMRSKQLRREMTAAERTLWNGLRGWGVGAVRRQQPIGRFILDFYYPAERLALEVDGGIHDDPDQRERDRLRTEQLAVLGIRVIRIRNEEILHDTRAVLRRIKTELSLRRPHSPLPRAGEGGGPKAAG